MKKKSAKKSEFELVSEKNSHSTTIIDLGNGISIGGNTIVIMAGPCAVENETQMEKISAAVKKAGASVLRGGAYKLRTSPHSFEGLGKKGLKLLSKVAKKNNLKTITEVIDVRDVEIVSQYADILQIGMRNMHNVPLLKEVGKSGKPVVLKRAMSATIQEFLLAAEYILMNGNPNVILCERGIRTFETDTRNTLALATVPLIKELSSFPIIVDPSHSTGKASLVPAMAKAALAAGADGILIDVHPNPSEALCDGTQAVTPVIFEKVTKELKAIAQAVGKKI